jgi:hypothetical protein
LNRAGFVTVKNAMKWTCLIDDCVESLFF